MSALGSASDTYGHIPNLRESIDKKTVFLPAKKSLTKFEKMAYNTASPNKFGNAGSYDSRSKTALSWEQAGASAADDVSAQNLELVQVEQPEDNFRIRNARRRGKKGRKNGRASTKKFADINN